jgi:GNAT superfamily N-acetyltransferase
MYRLLEQEMLDLHAMWPVADGVNEPVEESLAVRLESGQWFIFLGEIDEVPLGFISSRLDALLVQGGEEQIGLIDLIFTEPEARDVGIAEAMLDAALGALAAVGAERFDAPVLPGHRRAKNFFERSGFSARSITMHRRKR